MIAWSPWSITVPINASAFPSLRGKMGLVICARNRDITPPKQNFVSSHETINLVINKSIHQAEMLLSTSAVVSQSVCVHAIVFPTIKETKVPNTRNTNRHYTVKRGEESKFKYSEIQIKQEVVPPGHPSLTKRTPSF